MHDAIKALVVRHCETLKIEALAIEAALEDPTLDDSARQTAAFMAAHKLKGSSGTLGFADVSEAARQLEMALRALDGSVPIQQSRQVTDAHAVLSTLITRITPEQSSLYARMTA